MLHQRRRREEIRRHCDELLQRADAAGRWPTRVDDIVATANLSEPDESPIEESVLARAPKYLRKAVGLLRSGKVRALLDRRARTVHLDPSIHHQGRRSFLRLHEVAHDLLPWQSALGYADNDVTLSPATKRLFEQEANQGAAELLFQGARFAKMAADYRIGMGAVAQLANDVGASLRATLRRYAESHHGAVCGIVLEPSPFARQPLRYRRLEVSQSAAWTERFGSVWPQVLSEDGYPFLAAIPSPGLPPASDWTMPWPDLDCEAVDIRVEATANRFNVLLLVWVPRREIFKRRRTLVAEAA